MRYINYETNEEIILKQTITASVVKRKDDIVYFTNVKSLEEIRLDELINWFDNYFDRQLIQSQWQDDFKVSEDPYFKDENGNPKTYANIDELKVQAKVVREEIKRLRQN